MVSHKIWTGSMQFLSNMSLRMLYRWTMNGSTMTVAVVCTRRAKKLN